MRSFLIAATTAAALVSSASVTLADSFLLGSASSTPVSPGKFYGSIGGFAGAYRMPTWNRPHVFGTRLTIAFPIGAIDGNVGANFSPTQVIGGPALTFGYTFRQDLFPAWMGRRVRAEFTFGYAAGRGSQSQLLTFAPGLAGNGIRLNNINGTRGNAISIGQTFNLRERLKVDSRHTDLGLKLSSDHHVGRGLYLTTSFGFSGGWQVTQYDYNSFAIRSDGVLTLPTSASQRLSSRHIAGDAGLGVTWQATGWLALSVTGRFSVLWRQTRLTGQDCVSEGVGSSSCFALPNKTQSNVSDTDSVVGVRAGITAGAMLRIHGVNLRVNGFFNWDSATPGITNPGNVDLSANVFAAASPARVRHSGGWSAGASVMLIIPLN